MSLDFTRPLYWVSKYQPGKGSDDNAESSTLLSEHTNLQGQRIQISIANVVEDPNESILGDEIHVFRFFCQPQSVVAELRRIYDNQEEFFLPEEFGLSSVVFAKDNPLTAVPVVGEDFWHHETIPPDSNVDMYNGEIRVVAARVVA